MDEAYKQKLSRPFILPYYMTCNVRPGTNFIYNFRVAYLLSYTLIGCWKSNDQFNQSDCIIPAWRSYASIKFVNDKNSKCII